MTNKRIIFSAISLTVIIAALFFSPPPPYGTAAFAAARRDIPPGRTMITPTYPVLASLQATQMGDSSLHIRLRGYNMPLPRAASAPGEARLVLQWDGARFPQTGDKNDWWAGFDWDIIAIPGQESDSWWKQYDFPLLNRIIAEPVDLDSVRLIFVTTKPVVVENITGIAGSDELLITLKAFEPEKAPTPPTKPKVYEKGDPMAINSPVTLQLRDAELKSVFRMLADMQKLNLLLDPSVPDLTVTFSFNAVPYSEAFAYLLRTADLSYSVTKGMLVVGRPESLGRTLGTEVTKAYRLSYAVDREDGKVMSDMTAALTGLVSLSKPPTLDARSRELYVTATEEQHREIKEVIEKLDHPGRQVMLEAQIFEVNDTANLDFETAIEAVYDDWLVRFSQSQGLYVNYNSRGQTTPLSRSLTSNLQALERQGKGKTIANPSVITLDGQRASVSLTQNVQYAAGYDANGNPVFASLEIGPKLNFLPVIGRNGLVTITIDIETGEIQGELPTSVYQTLQSNARKVTTIVRVRDGEPFVVGGLARDYKNASKRRIPVLGFIPLLGEMFSYRATTREKTEVAIVVIPHILDVPNDETVEKSVLKRTSVLP